MTNRSALRPAVAWRRRRSDSSRKNWATSKAAIKQRIWVKEHGKVVARCRRLSALAGFAAQGHKQLPGRYFTASGVSSALATRRALSRMARVALPMLSDARETASTSTPTLNPSRTLLPLNCAANRGGSTEKYP